MMMKSFMNIKNNKDLCIETWGTPVLGFRIIVTNPYCLCYIYYNVFYNIYYLFLEKHKFFIFTNKQNCDTLSNALLKTKYIISYLPNLSARAGYDTRSIF